MLLECCDKHTPGETHWLSPVRTSGSSKAPNRSSSVELFCVGDEMNIRLRR